MFNGLAHFIKGGVFVGYGFLTLCRWMGCFAELGWAWNLITAEKTKSKDSTRCITMEAIECFLIFLYGVVDVFLEHLSGWGKPWIPQDFEHVAIALLFLGGGVVSVVLTSF